MLCRAGNSCPPLVCEEWAYSPREQKRGAGGREGEREGRGAGRASQRALGVTHLLRPGTGNYLPINKWIRCSSCSADWSGPRSLLPLGFNWESFLPHKATDTRNQSKGQLLWLPGRSWPAKRAVCPVKGALHPREAPLLPSLLCHAGLGGFLPASAQLGFRLSLAVS